MLSNSFINENSPINTVIGTLSAVGDPSTFSIVSGGSDFNINGNELRVSRTLNYEAASSYFVKIKATTAFNQTFEKWFTITLGNLNDNLPSGVGVLNLYDSGVTHTRVTWHENLAPGTIVAHIGVVDADDGWIAVYGQHVMEVGSSAGNSPVLQSGQLRLRYQYGQFDNAYITVNMNDSQTSPYLLVRLGNGIYALQKNPNKPIDYMVWNGSLKLHNLEFYCKVYDAVGVGFKDGLLAIAYL